MLNSPLVETAPFAGDRDRELRQLEASRALPLRLAELAPFAGDCDHEEERGLLQEPQAHPNWIPMLQDGCEVSNYMKETEAAQRT